MIPFDDLEVVRHGSTAFELVLFVETGLRECNWAFEWLAQFVCSETDVGFWGLGFRICRLQALESVVHREIRMTNTTRASKNTKQDLTITPPILIATDTLCYRHVLKNPIYEPPPPPTQKKTNKKQKP